jgi:membrane associated rhomboid family serine protease
MTAAPLADLPRYPAIGGTCLIALGIYAFASPEQVEPLQLDLRAFWAEPWRLLTSNLLHAGQLQSERWTEGLAHVGFNCYWLWKLGTAVEQRFGHLRTLGLLVLFGVAGSLLEYAFTGPSVGLSGVVYGLAALIWVLGRREPSWRIVLDKRTAQFLVFWFVFCVAATLADVMPIANFGHAGGALFGGLVGWAINERGRRRAGAIATTVATLSLFVIAGSVARPWVNFSTRAGIDAMVLSERAVGEDDLDGAIAWAERGVGYWRTPADHYAYLSWLYFVADRVPEAREALAEALRRDPDNADYAQVLAQYDAIIEARD